MTIGGCALVPAPAVLPPITNLDAQLACDGAPQPIGGEIGQIAPTGGTDTASSGPWLEGLRDIDLPLSGYEEVPKVPWEDGRAGFVRYEYRAQNRVKVVIVMAGHSVEGGRGAWQIVAFRACPGSEFDVADGRTIDNEPWVDGSGAPSVDVRAQSGPGHCGWQSTVWLWFRERVYLRDPLAVFGDRTVGQYLPQDTLPADAHATGFRSLHRDLFANADRHFVWVRTSAAIERWPAFREQPGCA
jgi:hypothetical protein